MAIARALVNRPALLFADEPTGNLDSRTSEEVLHMFQQLNAQERITLILVTHDDNVARYAGRVITIHDGVIMDPGFGGHWKGGASQKDVLPVAAATGGAE